MKSTEPKKNDQWRMRVDELAPPLCNHWLNGGRWLAAGAFDYDGICEKKTQKFSEKKSKQEKKMSLRRFTTRGSYRAPSRRFAVAAVDADADAAAAADAERHFKWLFRDNEWRLVYGR